MNFNEVEQKVIAFRDLPETISEKLEKNRKKYSLEKSKDSNKKYNEL